VDDVKLYWTVVVAVMSAGWVVTTFMRDRTSQAFDRSSTMINRLLEGDKIIIDNPSILMYLSQNAAQEEGYFCSASVLDEELFYKTKAFVYRELNIFDEILSISSRTGKRWSFMQPPALIEISDWETYIRSRLGHPLYRSILKNEGHIFGAELRDFWKRNRQAIESSPVDPLKW
jgi:hypothetical protein